MKAEPRPWRLEVDEGNGWEQWSTYRTEANALDRADRLEAKGHRARVVPDDPCPYCSGAHADPTNGECLL